MNKLGKKSYQNKIINLIIWAVVSWFLILLDQYTKYLAINHLKGKKPLILWEGVFEFLYSENRGAAFGILQGKQFFFFIIGIVVLIFAAYIMWHLPSWRDSHYCWLGFCIILITAGAAGNMVDRIIQGYVVDFLYFRLINFPIFNVADIYVTTATFALLLLMLFFYTEEDLEIFKFFPKSNPDQGGNTM
ncbi:MAG: signal peptidase II [Lachnospiraceae bacterium]|jgi:signal peptidase II|nr:signal peptidase II [Lachnospiraceae bacterium]MCI9281966.1 signal peptidase II [Lachnospiraceae bacterium]